MPLIVQSFSVIIFLSFLTETGIRSLFTFITVETQHHLTFFLSFLRWPTFRSDMFDFTFIFRKDIWSKGGFGAIWGRLGDF